MASFVSTLITDTLENMPFLGSSWRSKDDSHFPNRLQTRKLLTTLDDHQQIQSAPLVDLNRTALYDIPPPYIDATHIRPSNSYKKQLIDKLIDSATASNKNSAVDKKGILQGIKLVEIAVDEYESGNEAIALDIYLSGLDKMIMALPNLKDHKTKEALREKLSSLEDRVGIQQLQQLYQNNNEGDQIKSTAADRISSNNNNNASTTNTTAVDNFIAKFSILSNLLAPQWLLSIINHPDDVEEKELEQQPVNNDKCCEATTTGDSLLKFKRLGRTTTDIIVQCVVLFKQSPIPGLLYLVFSYFVHLLLWIDQNFQVVEKIQNLGVTCIKKLLQADEKYRLHEFASEALYTLVSASLKTIVAYKEVPAYLIEQDGSGGRSSGKHSSSSPSRIWSL